MNRLIGAALAVIAVILVMVTQRGVGIARDEVVYIQSGERYAAWWIGLVALDHGITERSVTQAFGGPGATDNNREHPPVMKTLFGLSERLLHGALGATDELTASRLPSAILHGAAVALVFAMALELWGLAEAIVAALLVLLLPRAIFHAGLACFDAPTMTLWFATVYAYWRGLDGRRWPWQVGVLWGLALATKHTALLLPFALGAHYAIIAVTARWRVRGAASEQAGGPSGGARSGSRLGAARSAVWAVIGYRGRVVASLAVLGPVTLYAVWPWLWFDPIHHIRDWLAFHANHVHYNYEYLGRNWNAPRFPWHVALVTTLFTVPVATLGAAALGTGLWLTRWPRRAPGPQLQRPASAPGVGSAEPPSRAAPGRPADRADHAPALLLALSAAASIGPFLLGTTPIFGADKHWMPVLPTICIAAAVGAVWAARTAAHALANRWPGLGGRFAQPLAVVAVGGCLVLASLAETSVAEPYALTWYNALAGGAPGGADLGMNRQFWGVAARGVLPQLVQAAGDTPVAGANEVYSHDASPAWGLYQKLGLVPRTLGDAGWEQGGIDRSRFALVIHERHFNRHDYLIWRAYGTVQPIYVLRSAGVPIVSLYRRPPH